MDLTAAAWLVEGAEVERELDDIGTLPGQEEYSRGFRTSTVILAEERQTTRRPCVQACSKRMRV